MAITLAALTVLVVVQWRPLRAFDTDVHQWVVAARGVTVVNSAKVLTHLGAVYIALPVLFLLGFLAPRHRSLTTRMVSALGIVSVAGLGMSAGLTVNALVNEQRPAVTDWSSLASGPAFPSGHTTTATIVAACCLWLLAPRLTVPQRRLAWAAAIVYAAVAGLTRVWLGVHWPSDVVGGWLVGIGWTALSYAAFASVTTKSKASTTQGTAIVHRGDCIDDDSGATSPAAGSAS